VDKKEPDSSIVQLIILEVKLFCATLVVIKKAALQSAARAAFKVVILFPELFSKLCSWSSFL